MSYINTQSTALVRVKLTNTGREKLAKGQLTFNSWVAGDSEVDYNYVGGWSEFIPGNPLGAANGEFFFYGGDVSLTRNIYSKVLRPKDDQNFGYFRSFLLDPDGNFIHPLSTLGNSVQLIKGLVSNEAEDRGFFSGSTVDDGLVALTTTKYIKEEGTIDLVAFDGQTDNTPFIQGVLSGVTLTATSADDYIMFRFSNTTLGSITTPVMTAATINQFYNITEISGSTIKVDRALPILSGFAGTIITYYTFPGGNDPIDDYYGASSMMSYWNTGTLSFDSNCDICVENIPVWNMNNVWTENMAGLFDNGINTYHGNELFGSEQYAGTKQFLDYNNNPPATTAQQQAASSYMDPFNKGISIIHYTNNCISNFYGEMFNIDGPTGKLLNLDIPVMWHRRSQGGTSSGTTLGMRFVSDTTEQYINNTAIRYNNLIEFSGMSVTPYTPKTVGKVFPALQIVIIEDEELLAAMSYKSNRNYSLPDLAANLIPPTNGDCSGSLKPGESMFLTYYLKITGDTGFNPTLPCQRYTVIDNPVPGVDQDVAFRLTNINQLPYMRKLESGGYDGYGFYADNFVLLAQVINKNVTTRPYTDQWREIDFTSPNITGVAGETIDPFLLEGQVSNDTGFILTGPIYSAATNFDLGSEIDMSKGLNYDKLTFGDERLYYGNLRTHIGATIYKSLFTIDINGYLHPTTSNPTYSTSLNEGNRYVSEIGILDSDNELVLIGKLSRPIPITNSSIASIELTIDF